MFNRLNRLSKTKDVQVTSKRGRSFFSPHFVIKFLKSQTAVTRITVVVSTKVSKKAVIRNRIKRVIRETLRLNLPALKSGDYVVIVKPSATKLETPLIRQQVLGLLRSARLL